MKLSDQKATLNFSDGKPSVEFPIYQGSVGPEVLDIRKLYAQTGMFTYDPGFMSTASCQSAITYIDGDKGELLYRGYPIEQLASGACDYLDTCYLLIHGELPNEEQRNGFHKLVHRHPKPGASPHFGYSLDRQNAYFGGHDLQIRYRPALYLSAKQSELCGQLLAHDVCDALRALHREPGD